MNGFFRPHYPFEQALSRDRVCPTKKFGRDIKYITRFAYFNFFYNLLNANDNSQNTIFQFGSNFCLGDLKFV